MSDTTAWYYETNGKQRGPVNREQIEALIEAEAVGPHTKVWNDTLEEWTALHRTRLRDLLAEEEIAPPPLPEPGPAPMAAAMVQPAAPAYVTQTGTLKIWIEILFWPQLLFSAIVGFLILRSENLRKKGELYDLGGEGPISGLLLLVALAGAVVFFIWLYRVSENARAISGETPGITSGWAVGWFFIPIANLWMPYQAVVGIWRRMKGDTDNEDTVAGWWIMFWIAIIAEMAAIIMITERVLFLGTIRGTLNFAGVAALLNAFSVYAAIEMVRGMEARQRQALLDSSDQFI